MYYLLNKFFKVQLHYLPCCLQHQDSLLFFSDCGYNYSLLDRFTKSKFYILLVIPISSCILFIVPRTLEVVTSLTSFDNIDSGYTYVFNISRISGTLTPIQALFGIGLNTPIYNVFRSEYSGLEISQRHI